MSITWTRLGYLGFMVPLSFWAISAIFFHGVERMGPTRIAFLLAAIATWFIGNKLNAESEGDEAQHQAFGFPMQFSGAALSVAGLILTFF
jgi:hypothetical protein